MSHWQNTVSLADNENANESHLILRNICLCVMKLLMKTGLDVESQHAVGDPSHYNTLLFVCVCVCVYE